ncbi:MAG: sn-glycerol-3-phosphate import ATP-binding protein UgpC [Devosiaceae bacterium]|nr:sn-glycerol-3-phosphate import ATP-binding protein UgpC [Devosiaceae bacterium MH13]
MARVTLEDVRKVYPNGFEAVYPCSFTVNHGELIVLVGPSGCGKSTLLRMVAGLESITEGEMSIGDRVVNDVDPADRNIAMVFQNYALYPHMTVANNMGYGLKNRGMAKAEIEQKVNDAAKMLNLSDYLERRPSQLSGGQRQRVAMGRAIVREPDLFLFDEPLSNLDAKLRNQMRIEIRSLQRRLDTTALYVTHDQVEAMTMADRIFVMNAGRIEQIGTPSEIYHHPQSTFVASFMGAPPMNLLPARTTGNTHVELADDLALPLVSHVDYAGPVQLGIRPEDVRLKDGGDGGTPFKLDIVEELGATRLLHGQLAGHAFTVAIPHEERSFDDTLTLDLPQDALHLFDHETGRRL